MDYLWLNTAAFPATIDSQMVAAVSAVMFGYFTSFLTSGQPGSSVLGTLWPAYASTSTGTSLVISPTGATVSSPVWNRDVCFDLWDPFIDQIMNLTYPEFGAQLTFFSIPDEGGALSTGALVGIVIGGVAALLLLVGGFLALGRGSSTSKMTTMLEMKNERA